MRVVQLRGARTASAIVKFSEDIATKALQVKGWLGQLFLCAATLAVTETFMDADSQNLPKIIQNLPKKLFRCCTNEVRG